MDYTSKWIVLILSVEGDVSSEIIYFRLEPRGNFSQPVICWGNIVLYGGHLDECVI